jgi:hypothetical protein
MGRWLGVQLGTQLLTSPTLSLERETLNAEKRGIVEEMCVLVTLLVHPACPPLPPAQSAQLAAQLWADFVHQVAT